MISNKLSEGHGPSTGQPEVVGDISDYNQQQQEQKYNNNAYPNLQQRPYGGQQSYGDGGQTGFLLCLYIDILIYL